MPRGTTRALTGGGRRRSPHGFVLDLPRGKWFHSARALSSSRAILRNGSLPPVAARSLSRAEDKKPLVRGCARNSNYKMADDFDHPLDELQDYM